MTARWHITHARRRKTVRVMISDSQVLDFNNTTTNKHLSLYYMLVEHEILFNAPSSPSQRIHLNAILRACVRPMHVNVSFGANHLGMHEAARTAHTHRTHARHSRFGARAAHNFSAHGAIIWRACVWQTCSNTIMRFCSSSCASATMM